MEILKEIDLSRFTSIRIGGKAKFFSEPESFEELSYIVKFSKEKDLPIFVLGGGSNTVFGDVRGIVLSTRKLRGFKVFQSGDDISLNVLTGTPLKDLVKLSVKENLEGIYKLIGFPATVGGAVAMNAGAFGVEMKDFLEEVTYLSWSGEIRTSRAEELNFSYRSSPFPELGLILSCKLKLRRSKESVLERARRIKLRRKGNQPVNFLTSGSTFKNPYPMYAGELLERVGMKGFRIGGVAFSEKHANFLVNLSKGSFEDVRRIVEEAKRRVYEEFGIYLEEEVKLIEDSGSEGWKIL